jgi:hypothetical protein
MGKSNAFPDRLERPQNQSRRNNVEGQVPRDNIAAGKWIFLATGAGDKDAHHLWREMELFLRAAELAEARKEAAAFKPVSEERAGGGK